MAFHGTGGFPRAPPPPMIGQSFPVQQKRHREESSDRVYYDYDYTGGLGAEEQKSAGQSLGPAKTETAGNHYMGNTQFPPQNSEQYPAIQKQNSVYNQPNFPGTAPPLLPNPPQAPAGVQQGQQNSIGHGYHDQQQQQPNSGFGYPNYNYGNQEMQVNYGHGPTNPANQNMPYSNIGLPFPGPPPNQIYGINQKPPDQQFHNDNPPPVVNVQPAGYSSTNMGNMYHTTPPQFYGAQAATSSPISSTPTPAAASSASIESQMDKFVKDLCNKKVNDSRRSSTKIRQAPALSPPIVRVAEKKTLSMTDYANFGQVDKPSQFGGTPMYNKGEREQMAKPTSAIPSAENTEEGKTKVFTGIVTQLQDNFGMIGDDVFFQKSSVKGPCPKIGDRVLVEAEYVTAMPFKWNSKRVQAVNKDLNINNYNSIEKTGEFTSPSTNAYSLPKTAPPPPSISSPGGILKINSPGLSSGGALKSILKTGRNPPPPPIISKPAVNPFLKAPNMDKYNPDSPEPVDFCSDTFELPFFPGRDINKRTNCFAPSPFEPFSPMPNLRLAPTIFTQHVETSCLQRRSPSPRRKNRSPSPVWGRSPSPIRRQRSPSPLRKRRSPSPQRTRRSPSPIRRQRSPSPLRIRRSSSPKRTRRSPSPVRKQRSPSPLQTRRRRPLSPKRTRRSPSPIRKQRSPSPLRTRRSSSPKRTGRSPSPRRTRRSRSPSPRGARRSRSSSPKRKSPIRVKHSPSPRRTKRSPIRKRRSSSPRSYKRSQSPIRHKRSPGRKKRSVSPDPNKSTANSAPRSDKKLENIKSTLGEIVLERKPKEAPKDVANAHSSSMGNNKNNDTVAETMQIACSLDNKFKPPSVSVLTPVSFPIRTSMSRAPVPGAKLLFNPLSRPQINPTVLPNPLHVNNIRPTVVNANSQPPPVVNEGHPVAVPAGSPLGSQSLPPEVGCFPKSQPSTSFINPAFKQQMIVTPMKKMNEANTSTATLRKASATCSNTPAFIPIGVGKPMPALTTPTPMDASDKKKSKSETVQSAAYIVRPPLLNTPQSANPAGSGAAPKINTKALAANVDKVLSDLRKKVNSEKIVHSKGSSVHVEKRERKMEENDTDDAERSTKIWVADLSKICVPDIEVIGSSDKLDEEDEFHKTFLEEEQRLLKKGNREEVEKLREEENKRLGLKEERRLRELRSEESKLIRQGAPQSEIDEFKEIYGTFEVRWAKEQQLIKRREEVERLQRDNPERDKAKQWRRRLQLEKEKKLRREEYKRRMNHLGSERTIRVVEEFAIDDSHSTPRHARRVSVPRHRSRSPFQRHAIGHGGRDVRIHRRSRSRSSGRSHRRSRSRSVGRSHHRRSRSRSGGRSYRRSASPSTSRSRDYHSRRVSPSPPRNPNHRSRQVSYEAYRTDRQQRSSRSRSRDLEYDEFVGRHEFPAYESESSIEEIPVIEEHEVFEESLHRAIEMVNRKEAELDQRERDLEARRSDILSIRSDQEHRVDRVQRYAYGHSREDNYGHSSSRDGRY